MTPTQHSPASHDKETLMTSHATIATRAASAPSAASTQDRLRRVTGALFALGAITFGVAATVLSSTFNWPDILREPASVVLPEYADGGTSLTWTWFAVAWTYGILLVPILLLPTVLGRRDDPVIRAATFAGAVSVVLSMAEFLR